MEHKVETFSSVYKQLMGKDVNFEFPEFQLQRKLLNKVLFIVERKKELVLI